MKKRVLILVSLSLMSYKIVNSKTISAMFSCDDYCIGYADGKVPNRDGDE